VDSDNPLLPIVTLDGLAGSGKSTVGRALAGKLGAVFFSSGIMYRAVAAWLLGQGIELEEESVCQELVSLANFRLIIEQDSKIAQFSIDNQIITNIYDPSISEGASIVSRYKVVRDRLVDIQRELVRSCQEFLPANSIVLVAEGRDLGTVIYPSARYKIFLKGDSQRRVKERTIQLQKSMIDKSLIEEDISKEIFERDQRDSTRMIAPTLPAQDAEIIINDFNGVDFMVDKIINQLHIPDF
jgi:cytidylate kinase